MITKYPSFYKLVCNFRWYTVPRRTFISLWAGYNETVRSALIKCWAPFNYPQNVLRGTQEYWVEKRALLWLEASALQGFLTPLYIHHLAINSLVRSWKHPLITPLRAFNIFSDVQVCSWGLIYTLNPVWSWGIFFWVHMELKGRSLTTFLQS